MGFWLEHLEGERCQLVPWEDWKEVGLREDQSSVYVWEKSKALISLLFVHLHPDLISI